jgi:hypothetical protein
MMNVGMIVSSLRLQNAMLPAQARRPHRISLPLDLRAALSEMILSQIGISLWFVIRALFFRESGSH